MSESDLETDLESENRERIGMSSQIKIVEQKRRSNLKRYVIQQNKTDLKKEIGGQHRNKVKQSRSNRKSNYKDTLSIQQNGRRANSNGSSCDANSVTATEDSQEMRNNNMNGRRKGYAPKDAQMKMFYNPKLIRLHGVTHNADEDDDELEYDNEKKYKSVQSSNGNGEKKKPKEIKYSKTTLQQMRRDGDGRIFKSDGDSSENENEESSDGSICSDGSKPRVPASNRSNDSSSLFGNEEQIQTSLGSRSAKSKSALSSEDKLERPGKRAFATVEDEIFKRKHAKSDIFDVFNAGNLNLNDRQMKNSNSLRQYQEWKQVTQTPDKIDMPSLPVFDWGQNKLFFPELELFHSPFEYFDKIMGDDFYGLVVHNTNEYARDKQQKLTRHEKGWTQASRWIPTNIDEVRGYFGLLYYMGIVRMPQRNMYFNNDFMTNLEFPRMVIRKIERFEMLQHYFCVYDVHQPFDTKKDPMHKIRPMINLIMNNCRKFYYPGREISLDESMIPYAGTHVLRRFMPRKPTRDGFKAFILAEPKTAYVHNWFLDPQDAKLCEGKFYEKSIFFLLKGYENKGHRIYVDRYYTSINLFTKLQKLGFGCTGTVQFSRLRMNNDRKLEIQDMNIGETKFFSTEKNGAKLLLVCWLPKRLGLVMCNYNNSRIIEVEKLQKFKVKKDSLKKWDMLLAPQQIPQMIHDYNQFKGGVDTFDSQMQWYRYDLPIQLKWYNRLVSHMMEVAMCNAHTIFKRYCMKRQLHLLSHVEFRHNVIARQVRPHIQNRFAQRDLKYGTKFQNIMRASCLLGQANSVPKLCSICMKVNVTTYCERHNQHLCVIGCYDLHWKQYCYIPAIFET